MSHRRPNSLVSRVLSFFEANPDEELTYADVAAKFDCSVKEAYSRLTEAASRGDPIEIVKVVRAKKSQEGARHG